jgi:hypothetical protein
MLHTTHIDESWHPPRCEAVTVMLLTRDHRLGDWTGVLGTPLDVSGGISTIQSSQVLAL